MTPHEFSRSCAAFGLEVKVLSDKSCCLITFFICPPTAIEKVVAAVRTEHDCARRCAWSLQPRLAWPRKRTLREWDEQLIEWEQQLINSKRANDVANSHSNGKTNGGSNAGSALYKIQALEVATTRFLDVKAEDIVTTMAGATKNDAVTVKTPTSMGRLLASLYTESEDQKYDAHKMISSTQTPS